MTEQFDNRYVAKLPSASGWKSLGVSRLLYVRPEDTKPEELDDLNDDFVAYQKQGLEIKMLSLGDFGPSVDADPDDNRQYWGRSPTTHAFFWPRYGWYSGSLASAASQSGTSFAPASLAYTPKPRATIFSGRTVGGLPGAGKQKPSGFGRVSVRTNPRTGAVTGYAAGRSGSFGRTRSSWGG